MVGFARQPDTPDEARTGRRGKLSDQKRFETRAGTKDGENESYARAVVSRRGLRFLRLRSLQETQSTQVIPWY